VRSFIYQRPFDKKKFTDICEKKRKKIDQIALENCLPSIFNNAEQQRKYLGRFFNKTGPPNFCYRDDYQSTVKGYWDLYYYFIKGASVDFIENTATGNVEIGRIKTCNINEKKLTIITSEDVIVEKNFNEVARIFSSDFFENIFKPNQTS